MCANCSPTLRPLAESERPNCGTLMFCSKSRFFSLLICQERSSCSFITEMFWQKNPPHWRGIFYSLLFIHYLEAFFDFTFTLVTVFASVAVVVAGAAVEAFTSVLVEAVVAVELAST